MKPIDTAGKAIHEILILADENKQLKVDLILMTRAKEGAFQMIERLQEEIKRDRKKIKHESQDYSMLAGLVLLVWFAYMGLVVNG